MRMKDTQTHEITDQTKIPLPWLAFAMVFFMTTGVGAIFWLTTLYADVAQAKRDIAESKSAQKDMIETLSRMDHGLIKVQIKLGIPTDD